MKKNEKDLIRWFGFHENLLFIHYGTLCTFPLSIVAGSLESPERDFVRPYFSTRLKMCDLFCFNLLEFHWAHVTNATEYIETDGRPHIRRIRLYRDKAGSFQHPSAPCGVPMTALSKLGQTELNPQTATDETMANASFDKLQYDKTHICDYIWLLVGPYTIHSTPPPPPPPPTTTSTCLYRPRRQITLHPSGYGDSIRSGSISYTKSRHQTHRLLTGP